MAPCSRWDIVLVPFPFTDLTSAKRRPALVVSPAASNHTGSDRVIAFLTSQVHAAPRPGDYRLQSWREAGLPQPTMLRMKFATVARAIVIKTLGRVVEADRTAIRDALIAFLLECRKEVIRRHASLLQHAR